jgi:hypothetical protein
VGLLNFVSRRYQQDVLLAYEQLLYRMFLYSFVLVKYRLNSEQTVGGELKWNTCEIYLTFSVHLLMSSFDVCLVVSVVTSTDNQAHMHVLSYDVRTLLTCVNDTLL